MQLFFSKHVKSVFLYAFRDSKKFGTVAKLFNENTLYHKLNLNHI